MTAVSSPVRVALVLGLCAAIACVWLSQSDPLAGTLRSAQLVRQGDLSPEIELCRDGHDLQRNACPIGHYRALLHRRPAIWRIKIDRGILPGTRTANVTEPTSTVRTRVGVGLLTVRGVEGDPRFMDPDGDGWHGPSYVKIGERIEVPASAQQFDDSYLSTKWFASEVEAVASVTSFYTLTTSRPECDRTCRESESGPPAERLGHYRYRMTDEQVRLAFAGRPGEAMR
jgi:hypothetical protein